MTSRGRFERYASLPEVFRVILKRKFIVFLAVGLSVLVAAFFLRRQEVQYQTHASVEVQYFFAARGGFPYGITDLTTELNVVTSLPVMLDVAKKMGRIPAETTLEEASRQETVFSVIRDYQSKVEARKRERTAFIDIVATSGEPREARDLANYTAQAYRTYRTQRSRERAQHARDLTGGHKQKLEEMEEKAEQEMNEFKLSHRLSDTGSTLSVQLNRLVDLEEKDQSLVWQEEAVRNVLGVLTSDVASQEGTLNSLTIPEAPPNYEQLRQDYTQLLLRRQEQQLLLTTSHPLVREMEERLAVLRAQLVHTLGGLLEESGRKRLEIDQQKAQIEAARSDYLKDEIEMVRLRRRVERYQSMLEQMEQAYQTAEFEDSFRADYVQVVELALLPTEPVHKIQLAPVLPVMFLGLIAGIGLAFLREAFDFSLENVAEVEALVGLPVLSVIPHFNPQSDRVHKGRAPPAVNGSGTPYFREKMVAHFWPKNPTSESFRILRMALRGGLAERRLFMVSSATPQEGKSFITSNLAITFAQAGYSTLLVEANTRRPTMHKIFPLRADDGLTNVVLDNRPWRDEVRSIYDLFVDGLDPKTVQESPGLDNLHILPAGPTPVHPSETLMQLTSRGFLQEAKRAFETVIVDCPPILPVADATVIAPHVDAVILVYRIGRTPRDMLMRAIETIKGAGGNLIGIVLNDIDYHGPYFYPRYLYRYQYRGYTPEADAASQRWWRRLWRGGAEKPVPPHPEAQGSVPGRNGEAGPSAH
ncbi:MAG: polysaccharide biosynthesis tyrosine autokinase [Nitrospirae bacterium]|nr:polysaccharide biosynthesis tyrosine autokinase [Nitrospirota bacterium]